MSHRTLFGSSSSARFSKKGIAAQNRKNSKERPRPRLRALKVILSLVLIVEILYCVAIFSPIPFIRDLRDMYIETAMSTMSHRWLATYFIPKDIVDEVVNRTRTAREEQMGHNSTWIISNAATVPTDAETITPGETRQTTPPLSPEQEAFFDLYWEVDPASMLSYVEQNPDVVANGWDKIYINEAGLEDDGTPIKTTMGEQILAIDVQNQILLIRVTGSTYQGVLAVAKDPSRLRLCPSGSIGSYGQQAGVIAQHNDGVLAMTGSGFIDNDGAGNGGDLAGACMSSGKAYGRHFGWGYKRIELHEDNRLYVTDASNYFSDDCTDAVEFMPALIVDGENALGYDNIFTEMNPRACLGQSKREEILMLVIEGRLVGRSLGTDAEECVEILMRHDCYQAMNLDGGTSAILWYDGEYVTRCSNTALPEGRHLPNAWVYGTEPVE